MLTSIKQTKVSVSVALRPQACAAAQVQQAPAAFVELCRRYKDKLIDGGVPRLGVQPLQVPNAAVSRRLHALFGMLLLFEGVSVAVAAAHCTACTEDWRLSADVAACAAGASMPYSPCALRHAPKRAPSLRPITQQWWKPPTVWQW